MLQFWVQVLIQQSFVAKHLMIQGQHLALRCRHQKRSMPTGSLSTDPTIDSGPLTGNRPWHHQKGEENYLTQLDQ
jgi:hypothetical protein